MWNAVSQNYQAVLLHRDWGWGCRGCDLTHILTSRSNLIINIPGVVLSSCPKSNLNINLGIHYWIEIPNCIVWKYWGIYIDLQIWYMVLNFNRWRVLNRLTTVSVRSIWQGLICIKFNNIDTRHYTFAISYLVKSRKSTTTKINN